jgi:hypothetical protein
MTPTRFRECLDALHWTQRGLARILGRPEGTVRQWARGAVQIPDDEAVWLEFLAIMHEKTPPPRRETRDVIVTASGGGGSHPAPLGGGAEPPRLYPKRDVIDPDALDSQN